MNRLRFSVALSLVFGLSAASAQAQDQPPAPELPPCVSDWACGSTRPPLGFYVDSITDDGRYVTLEDGTVWEIQIDDRAGVAGWQRDQFVDVRRIAAPRGDGNYEWLLTRVDGPDWRAAARLVGRARRP